MHIPKAGGTSLQAWLHGAFAVDRIAPRAALDHPELEYARADFEPIAPSFAGYDLVVGHFRWPAARLLGPARFLTMLRDPVDRVISLYNDWSTKTEENYAEGTQTERELIDLCRAEPIGEVVRSELPAARQRFRSGQARQLAGVGAEEIAEDTLVEAACEALQQFDVVGLTEAFAPSCMLARARLELGPTADPPHLNTARGAVRRAALDPETLATIEGANRADQRVYADAVRLFNRQFAGLLRAAGAAGLEGLDRDIPSEPRRVELPMAGPLRGNGWHVREGVGGPKVWRWSGPEREATLELPLAPGADYELRIFVISVIEQAILDETELMVGDRAAAWTNEGLIDGEQVMRARVPGEVVARRGPTRVSLTVPHTRSHAEVEPETGDHRQKGLAVTRVVAEPVPVEALGAV